LGTSKPTVDLPGIGARMRMRDRLEGHRQVVLEALDLRQLDAGLGLELVAGDHRAGVDLGDLAA
jgi:hypothetical protein